MFIIADKCTGANQREREEEEKRNQQNQELASSSYQPPDVDQVQDSGNESGLPWGGISLSYMLNSSVEARVSSSSPQEATTATADSSIDKDKSHSSTKESGKEN
jgi:hypothetical protein